MNNRTCADGTIVSFAVIVIGFQALIKLFVGWNWLAEIIIHYNKVWP